MAEEADAGSVPYAKAIGPAVAIGVDESGKSQLVGPLILGGVAVPHELASDMEAAVGLARTKDRHPLP